MTTGHLYCLLSCHLVFSCRIARSPFYLFIVSFVRSDTVLLGQTANKKCLRKKVNCQRLVSHFGRQEKAAGATSARWISYLHKTENVPCRV
jgi:hypothetical protein